MLGTIEQQKQLAKGDNLPDWLWEALLEEKEVHCSLAENFGTPNWAIERIIFARIHHDNFERISDYDIEVVALALSHHLENRVIEETLSCLTKNNMLSKLLETNKLNKQIYFLLVQKDRGAKIHELIAECIYAPPDILRILAMRKGPKRVLRALVENIATPDDILKNLARNPDYTSMVALNPSISRELFAVLATNPNPAIRQKVISNIMCPITILQTLEKDGEPSIAEAASVKLNEIVNS